MQVEVILHKNADKCAQQFAKEFGNQKDSLKDGQGKETKERIIAQLFNTISSLQKIYRV